MKELIKNYIKTANDFGGYWIKNMKIFKGHEGEPCIQCSVYKGNKKIGFFSEDSWGGPAQFQGFEPEDLKELETYAQSISDSIICADHIFINSICSEVEFQKKLKSKCRKKALLILPEFKEGEYIAFNMEWSEKTKQIIINHCNEKYGKGKYAILNTAFEK